MRGRRAYIEVVSNQPETVQTEELWLASWDTKGQFMAWVKGSLKRRMKGMQTWGNNMVNRLLEEDKSLSKSPPCSEEGNQDVSPVSTRADTPSPAGERANDLALSLAVSPGDTPTEASDSNAAATRLPPIATAVGQPSRQDQQPSVSLPSLESQQPSQPGDQTTNDGQIAPDWYRSYREQHKQHWRQMHPLGADCTGVAITTEWYTWYRMDHRRLQALKREKAPQGGGGMRCDVHIM